MMSYPQEAKDLFLDCFDSDENEAEIILSFAHAFGEISLSYLENEPANMICRTEIGCGGFTADYIFACCTEPKFRNKGIFSRRLIDAVGDKTAFLIPERKELFSFYQKLGFEPIIHLEAEFFGIGCAKDVNDVSCLYDKYAESEAFPRKSKPLFEATLKAFLAYGGRIKEKDGVFMLVRDNVVTEFFGKSKSLAIDAVENCLDGCFTVLMPASFEEQLKSKGVKYEKKSIAMAKNIDPSQMPQIYLNNLFN